MSCVWIEEGIENDSPIKCESLIIVCDWDGVDVKNWKRSSFNSSTPEISPLLHCSCEIIEGAPPNPSPPTVLVSTSSTDRLWSKWAYGNLMLPSTSFVFAHLSRSQHSPLTREVPPIDDPTTISRMPDPDVARPRPRPRGPCQLLTASSADRCLSAPSFVSASPPCSKDLTSTVEREEQGSKNWRRGWDRGGACWREVWKRQHTPSRCLPKPHPSRIMVDWITQRNFEGGFRTDVLHVNGILYKLYTVELKQSPPGLCIYNIYSVGRSSLRADVDLAHVANAPRDHRN